MTAPSNRPELAEIIARALERRLISVHTSIPAKVLRYDASKQRVDCQPLIRAEARTELGETVAESLPVITGVPVNFHAGGGFRVTFPLVPGDTGFLIFAEASLDKWKTNGGEVDPLDYHRFHISDAIFVPGIRPFSSPLGSAPTNALSIGKDEGITIDITAAEIHLAGADQGIGLGNNIHTALANLKTAFDSHTHTVPGLGLLDSGVPGGPVTGAATASAPSASPALPTVESDRVKTKTPP